MTAESFTRAAYATLLSNLLERGYRGCSFPEALPDRRDLLLRHDIDIWPRAALALAEIEWEQGLAADYFFLMHSPLYETGAPDTCAVIEILLSLGHRIGLHFDTARYADDLATQEREAARECAALETLTGQPIKLISFHRPAKSLLGYHGPIAGRAHAYQPRYFTEIGYCSDSRGQWRYGHPLTQESVIAGRALQLLTHPIWWESDCAGDREAALARVVEARGNAIKPALAETITGYCPETGRILETD